VSADVSSDLRAAWSERSETDRKAFVASIVELIAAKLRTDTAPWYPGASQQEPHVQVHAAKQLNRRLTLCFVADHLTYCFAQSGSDWADHYIFVGEATFEEGSRVDESFALVEHVRLSELEADAYDQDAVVATVRDAAIAKHRGLPVVEGKTDEVIRNMREAVEAEVARAHAKSLQRE